MAVAAAASPPSTRHGREPLLAQPVRWLRMLCEELGGSFVAGVVLVHGFNQGFLGSFFKVVSDFYWKDVQKVQPSQVQLFVGFYYLPWILKPLWGLLTDVFPISGYKRRPYFLLSGALKSSSSSSPIRKRLSLDRFFLGGVGGGVGIDDFDVREDVGGVRQRLLDRSEGGDGHCRGGDRCVRGQEQYRAPGAGA